MGTTHPIDDVAGLEDTNKVSKSGLVGYEKTYVGIRLQDVADIRARNLTGSWLVFINGLAYVRDATDTTSADDGSLIIIDLAGNRWKHVIYALVSEVLLATQLDTDGTLATNSDAKIASQKAVRTYVDGKVVNLGKRARVRAATTANITISSALNNASTLDGVTLATGDQVLVKDQSNAQENGIYVVGVSPVRATEFDTYNEHPGSVIVVEEGTTNADSMWFCTSNEGGTLNTTAISFSRIRIDISIPVTVTQGGTNATTAANARTNLGVAYGKQSVWVPAGSMTPNITNGPARGTVEMTTNKNMVITLDFDTTTQEFAQFSVRMPKSWDLGTVSFIPVWSHAATVTNFGVVWGLDAVAVHDNGALDVAFGTEQTSTDTGGTTNNKYEGPESSAITITGSPAAGDLVAFRVHRDPANVSDTLAIDARLHGVLVLYTNANTNDT